MNRFFRQSHQHSRHFYFPLPDSWWSRPYEYVWALKWARGSVLDAACGISHPFKFALAETPAVSSVHACDLKGMSVSEIIDEVRRDLGQEVNPAVVQKLHLANCSIDALPFGSSEFDTIFCLSVLEHLSPETIKGSLSEFNRTLKRDGRLILTCDHPNIEPYKLLEWARDAGFGIDEYDYSIPSDAIYEPSMNLRCFSMVLDKVSKV